MLWREGISPFHLWRAGPKKRKNGRFFMSKRKRVVSRKRYPNIDTDTSFADLLGHFNHVLLHADLYSEKGVKRWLNLRFFPVLATKLLHVLRTHGGDWRPHFSEEDAFYGRLPDLDKVEEDHAFLQALERQLPLFVEAQLGASCVTQWAVRWVAPKGDRASEKNWIDATSIALERMFTQDSLSLRQPLQEWVNAQRVAMNEEVFLRQRRPLLYWIYDHVFFQWLGPAVLAGHYPSFSANVSADDFQLFRTHSPRRRYSCALGYRFHWNEDQVEMLRGEKVQAEDLFALALTLELIRVWLPEALLTLVFGYMLDLSRWIVKGKGVKRPAKKWPVVRHSCGIHTKLYVPDAARFLAALPEEVPLGNLHEAALRTNKRKRVRE
jgi:hypothetical protein